MQVTGPWLAFWFLVGAFIGVAAVILGNDGPLSWRAGLKYTLVAVVCFALAGVLFFYLH